MIESRFWKEHLRKYVRSLKRSNRPSRWSERALCNFERDLIVHFFSVRKLIELHKVSSRTRNHQVTVFLCASKGVPVTRLNRIDMWDLYQFEKQVEKKRSLFFIANQFIHSYLIVPYKDEVRKWDGVFVCSDFERNNAIYRVPLSEIQKALLIASEDRPTRMVMKYDHTIKDYQVTTN